MPRWRRCMPCVAFGMLIPDEPADVDLLQPVKANAGSGRNQFSWARSMLSLHQTNTFLQWENDVFLWKQSKLQPNKPIGGLCYGKVTTGKPAEISAAKPTHDICDLICNLIISDLLLQLILTQFIHVSDHHIINLLLHLIWYFKQITIWF